MRSRLWYPQLDAYDALCRQAGLLALWRTGKAPSVERLYIADFYLATPALLHRTQMAQEVRKEFNKLRIVRPDKTFVSYPSAPILFQKMGEVQRQAFQTLMAKGLLDLPKLQSGSVVPTAPGRELFRSAFLPLFSTDEKTVAEFLTSHFIGGENQPIEDLRRGTGLRRVGI